LLGPAPGRGESYPSPEASTPVPGTGSARDHRSRGLAGPVYSPDRADCVVPRGLRGGIPISLDPSAGFLLGRPAEKEDQVCTRSRVADRGGKHTVSGKYRLGAGEELVEALRIPRQGRAGERGRVRKTLYSSGLSTEKTLQGGTDLERIPGQIVARPARGGRSKAAVEAGLLGRAQPGTGFGVGITARPCQACQRAANYHHPGQGSPGRGTKSRRGRARTGDFQ